MLFRVFSVVFMLPFGVYLFRGVFVAGFIVRTSNFVMTDTKAPLLLAGEHFLYY